MAVIGILFQAFLQPRTLFSFLLPPSSPYPLSAWLIPIYFSDISLDVTSFWETFPGPL